MGVAFQNKIYKTLGGAIKPFLFIQTQVKYIKCFTSPDMNVNFGEFCAMIKVINKLFNMAIGALALIINNKT